MATNSLTYAPNDEQPSVRKGLPAVGSEPKSGFSKMYGPLPLWGWGIVAIAGIILYRKIYAPGGGNSGSDTVAPSTSPGGVFLLPGGGSGSGGSAYLPGFTELGSTGVQIPVDEPQLINQQVAANQAAPPQPLSPAGISFLQNLSQQPDEADLATFFQDNAAAKQLGLPYFTGSGQQMYDPRTGQTFDYSPPASSVAASIAPVTAPAATSGPTVAQFLQANAAAKNAGQPYFTGNGTQMFNPASGSYSYA